MARVIRPAQPHGNFSTGPPPRRSSMARAIPDQPSRTATSISIVHRVHRRTARANYVAKAASSVTNGAPARSPMARTIPDPTEYIPGSSKRPARSRSSRISRHEVRQQQRHELRHDRHHAGHRTAATEDVATLLDGAIQGCEPLQRWHDPPRPPSGLAPWKHADGSTWKMPTRPG